MSKREAAIKKLDLTFKKGMREFLDKDTITRNIWTKYHYTEVYFRISKRLIYNDQTDFLTCLDIATLVTPAKYQRKHYFSRMLITLRSMTELPFYVENAFPEFAEALLQPKYGFRLARSDLFGKSIIEDKPNNHREIAVRSDWI